jgi:hypothetical protein
MFPGMMPRKMRGLPVTRNLHHKIRGFDFHRGFIRESHPAVKRVEHLLPLAAIGDHVIAPQQTKMMAHRGLWKPQFFAKGSDVPLAPGQGQKNVHARLIG